MSSTELPPQRSRAAYQGRKARGLCVDCSQQAVEGQVKCEQCSAKARARYRANRSARLQKLAEWREKNPDYAKKYDLKRKYGLTLEQWNEKFDEQGRMCAICDADSPGGKGHWHTDHDHRTGRVRGILCQNCNLLLGHSLDNTTTLRKATQYLETR